MKYLYLFLVVLLFACSGSDDNAEVELPEAVNDVATTSENTAVTINVLSNDNLTNMATLADFDSNSSENGSIVEVSNRLVYTPPTDFNGTDTFTYTICDALSDQNCAIGTVTVTVTDEGTAVALDDAIEVVENTTTVLTELLENDTLIDGATLQSINTSLTTGTAVLNTDGSISYTSNNGFTGEDTFTYTICDTDETPECSTATVIITVLDEGTPEALDDSYTVLSGSSVTVFNVLSNDALLDDATLTSTNNSDTQGVVTLNSDGTINYTPATGFEGEDTFTYTICDDDETEECATATVTVYVVTAINFNIPADLDDYYSDVIFSEDADLLFDNLRTHTVQKHTTILSYSQRHDYLYNADADLSNQDNVILMYSGESRYWEEYTSGNNSYGTQTFNTEHIYPQSLLSSEIAVTDLHHLRSCDDDVNELRSNYAYTNATGTYSLQGGNKWYPGDEWRGDVARMVLYLNVRYGETFTKVGGLELFLEWNVLDPVSEFEMQRNNVIEWAQGNRNPFIDNPYLATLIWGGTEAENKW